jgi:hypothetical protein
MPDRIELFNSLVEEFKRELDRRLDEFERRCQRELEKRIRMQTVEELKKDLMSLARLAVPTKDNLQDYLRLLRAVEEVERQDRVESSTKMTVQSFGFTGREDAVILFATIGKAYEELKRNKALALDLIQS